MKIKRKTKLLLKKPLQVKGRAENLHHQPTSNSSTSSSSLQISESLLKSSDSSSGYTSERSASNSTDSTNEMTTLTRPPISYACLITEAIQKSPQRQLLLGNIYSYIETHYPYFQQAGTGWKNSVRHNLSLNKAFCKTPRQSKSPGKGSYWRLATDFERSSSAKKPLSQTNDYYRRPSLPHDKDIHPENIAFIHPIRMRSVSEGSVRALPQLLPKPTAQDDMFCPMTINYSTSQRNFQDILEMTSSIGQPMDNNQYYVPDTSSDSLGSMQEFPNMFSLRQHTLYKDAWLGISSPKLKFSENERDSPVNLIPINIDHNQGSSEGYESTNALFLK